VHLVGFYYMNHHGNIHYAHTVPTFCWTQNFTGTKASLLTRYGWFNKKILFHTLWRQI